MSYTGLNFYILLGIIFLIYHIFPMRFRWTVLLTGSCLFYVLACPDRSIGVVFVLTIAASYAFSLILDKYKNRAYFVLALSVTASVLILSKSFEYISVLKDLRARYLLPLGLSFYTLSIISYLTDVYKGRVRAQRNFFKYMLFVSFFPVIVQGPIHRYDELAPQLFEGHGFDGRRVMRGINFILWGFFLKLMIADKAGVIVNTIDGSPLEYRGFYIPVSAFFFILQLYCDFQSCVMLSKGIALLFGITVRDNFRQPFFSLSVKEMWTRWHMSLGEWLRDHIYIPLGGNKKGEAARIFNLTVTFFISGLWHGVCPKFICWGLLQVLFQILESRAGLEKKSIRKASELTLAARTIRRIYAFLAMTFGFFIFKSTSLTRAALDCVSVIKDANPWIFFNDSLFRLGLPEKEFFVLIISLLIVFAVDYLKEKGVDPEKRFMACHTALRWLVYYVAIWSIWIFGTYGYGFDSSAFIYGGF